MSYRLPSPAAAAFLALAFALAGCLSGADSTFGPAASGGTVTGVNAAGNGLPLSASATPARGPAPLAVTFSLQVLGAPADASWTLGFGDDSKPHSGGNLPDSVEHVYRTAGTFTANFTVEEASGAKSVATLQITVLPARSTSDSSTSEADEQTPSLTSASSTSSAPPPPPPPPPSTTTSSSSSTSATETTSSSSSSADPSTNSTTTSASTTDSATSSTSATTAPPTSSSTTTTTDSSTATTTAGNSTAAPPPTSSSTTDSQTGTAQPTPSPSESATTTDPPA